ncbi:MAG TPA: EAL domain-containing protein [Gammaproteobacteria bacterium]
MPHSKPQSNLPQLKNQGWLHPSYQEPMLKLAMVITALALLLAMVNAVPPHPSLEQVPGYLSFHLIFELISIIIAMLIFVVGWHAYERKLPGDIFLLACAFFAVAVLDLSHTLSFPGMPDFITPSDTEKGINFWLAARTVAAAALLLVAIRRLPAFQSNYLRYLILGTVIILLVLLHWLFLFYPQLLPATFDKEHGLTRFKIGYEYALIGTNLLAAVLLLLHMRKLQEMRIVSMFGAVTILALSELCFTLYSDAADIYNLLGHIYKFVGYLFLYQGIFVDTFDRPYTQLQSSQDKLQATLDASPDLLFEIDMDGRYVDYHSSRASLLIESGESLIGKSIFDVMPEEAANICMSALHEADLKGHSSGKQIVLDVAEGKRYFELSVSRKPSQVDEIPHFIVLSRDITERRESDQQMHKLMQAVEQNPNSIVITDLDANIEYANPAFMQVTGYTLQEVMGQNPRILHSGKTPNERYIEMWSQLTQGKSWKGEFVNCRKDGTEYTELVSISPVRQSDGTISNYLAIKEDVTQKKQMELQIEKIEHFDLLTDLPNNALLRNRADFALSYSQRQQQKMAVMFLDIDNFNHINNSHGRSAGDEILIQLALRLRNKLRDEDTVSRISGDEFILLFSTQTDNNALHLAEKLLQLIAQPFYIETDEFLVTCSIGIAMYPDDGADFETLSKNAEVAMYRAKNEGRNTIRFFKAEMQEHLSRSLLLGNALRYAMDRNQLQLHFQPQISLSNGRVIGTEALLRWQHPELGPISPAEFIPIAEHSGQIVSIGEWVLRTAVRQLKHWIDDGLPPMLMAVNLSAVQFKHFNLTRMVAGILEEEQLPARYLELELTESVTMSNPQGAIEIMDQLYEQGVRMSIDDFGTGYSSLSYLKQFKIYKLKIDQSFVRNITTDAHDKSIVATIISMANNLGFTTIAEGVETEQQLDILRQLGCDEVQGYFYSKPLPADQFEAFARDKNSETR